MLQRLAVAVVLSSCTVLGLAQIKAGQIKNPPSFNQQKLNLGPVKLNAAQMQNWKLMMDSIKPKPLATALVALNTGYTSLGSFPDPLNDKKVFASPQKPTRLSIRLDGLPSVRTTLVLQVATMPTTGGMIPPYAGWDAPAGMVYTEDFTTAIRSKPENPSDSQPTIIPNVPGTSEFGYVKLSDTPRYTYIQPNFPPAKLAKTGTYFYARVVPIMVRDGKRTPIGPASNWAKFYVTISEAEQQKQIQDAKIAQAKAEADKQNLKLVTEANEARKALWANYEIRLLSYIPPKFYDDADANLYFIASHDVSFQYDKNTKSTNIGTGETYYLVQMKNLLNSNKSWTQELWEVISATLNMASAAYAKAKESAVGVIASGLNTIPGVNCQGACKETLMTGLNMALAYCGIPPSIPNIDELYNKGLDYMAATIADMAIEEITGVAIDEFGANAQTTALLAEKAKGPAKDGLKKFLKDITEPAPFVADIPETWGRPAPFFRRRPAMMYLEIRRKPGTKTLVGQSWQAMELKFGNTFVDIPMILLPRTVNDKIRIPVALATETGPETWNVKGMMPEKDIDPAAGVGQPYYGDRGTVNVSIITTHRLGSNGTTFKALWPGFSISSGYVNGRPLPNKTILTKEESETGLNQPVALGPANYYGKIRLRWFQL